MFRPFATVALLAALAACEGGTNDAAVPAEPTATPEAAVSSSGPLATPTPGEARASPQPVTPAATECGSDKVGEYVGQMPTDDVKAGIAAKVGERPIRYYTEGDPITMDYAPARLNVELRENGRIERFRCG